MSAWPQVKLNTVADIERDGLASDNIQAGARYLGLEHIESGGRILGDTVVDAGELASTKFKFTRDHLLYGKLRPYLAKIALPDFEGICSTDIVPIKTGPRLDRRYLAYFLRQPDMVDFANSRSTGANLPRLSPKALAEFEIPLPPLDEQKRIAAILDQADELRCKRQRAIDRLNQLGQAIFHEQFGDPATNPHGFPAVALGDLIKVSSGAGLIASDQKGGVYPVYGGNGVNGWHDDFTVPAGTIVIGRVGVYCGAVHVTDRPAWVTDNALVVSLKRPVNPTYLAAALKIANLNQYAGRSAQPLVSGSRIYPIEILNPPSGKQDLYETKIRQFEVISGEYAEARRSSNSLFSALQYRAFQGEL